MGNFLCTCKTGLPRGIRWQKPKLCQATPSDSPGQVEHAREPAGPVKLAEPAGPQAANPQPEDLHVEEQPPLHNNPSAFPQQNEDIQAIANVVVVAPDANMATAHPAEQQQAPPNMVDFVDIPPPMPQMIDLEVEIQTGCKDAVLLLFPDICPDYLDRTCGEWAYDHEHVVTFILDHVERNGSYPKRSRCLKRKRSDLEQDDDDPAKKFDNDEHHRSHKDHLYIKTARELLMQYFPRVRSKDAERILQENHNCLFPSYFALEGAYRVAQAGEPGAQLNLKLQRSQRIVAFQKENLDATIQNSKMATEKAALEELKAALTVCDRRQAKADAERQREQDEIDNFNLAAAEGTLAECGCCFDEFPMNRMVHCSGESLHWFCRRCARMAAETQIGLAKYELNCMSVDGCGGTFSLAERTVFLDENSLLALERLEQEAMLRMAGLELATCPFCPYAAEYPPVEEDREFRCERDECRIVSCRLCRLESHIPRTCVEAARENGHSARRQIEEAMSAAMIRKCNKCSTPFVKEGGCNKMTCTRNGCRSSQCYVCGESCDYSHFDDQARGGRPGNCPLFDDGLDTRHVEEVQAAEEKARKLVAEEHPDVDADLLQFNVSDRVRQEDERRMQAVKQLKAANAAARGGANNFLEPPNGGIPIMRAPIPLHKPPEPLAQPGWPGEVQPVPLGLFHGNAYVLHGHGNEGGQGGAQQYGAQEGEAHPGVAGNAAAAQPEPPNYMVLGDVPVQDARLLRARIEARRIPSEANRARYTLMRRNLQLSNDLQQLGLQQHAQEMPAQQPEGMPDAFGPRAAVGGERNVGYNLQAMQDQIEGMRRMADQVRQNAAAVQPAMQFAELQLGNPPAPVPPPLVPAVHPPLPVHPLPPYHAGLGGGQWPNFYGLYGQPEMNVDYIGRFQHRVPEWALPPGRGPWAMAGAAGAPRQPLPAPPPMGIPLDLELDGIDRLAGVSHNEQA